jgi:hypothetical protein
MTQVAPRRLDTFTLASEPGNERLALARVAGTVKDLGLDGRKLERLKTEGRDHQHLRRLQAAVAARQEHLAQLDGAQRAADPRRPRHRPAPYP